MTPNTPQIGYPSRFTPSFPPRPNGGYPPPNKPRPAHPIFCYRCDGAGHVAASCSQKPVYGPGGAARLPFPGRPAAGGYPRPILKKTTRFNSIEEPEQYYEQDYGYEYDYNYPAETYAGEEVGTTETGAAGGEASGTVLTNVHLGSMNDALQGQHLDDAYESYELLADGFPKAI